MNLMKEMTDTAIVYVYLEYSNEIFSLFFCCYSLETSSFQINIICTHDIMQGGKSERLNTAIGFYLPNSKGRMSQSDWLLKAQPVCLTQQPCVGGNNLCYLGLTCFVPPAAETVCMQQLDNEIGYHTFDFVSLGCDQVHTNFWIFCQKQHR